MHLCTPTNGSYVTWPETLNQIPPNHKTMLGLYMTNVSYKIIEYIAFIQGYILYSPREQIQRKIIPQLLLPPKSNLRGGLRLKGNIRLQH